MKHTNSVHYESLTHGFSLEDAMVRGVLFMMLRMRLYKYSNELPLMATDKYIEDHADYEQLHWAERDDVI